VRKYHGPLGLLGKPDAGGTEETGGPAEHILVGATPVDGTT